MSHPRGLTPEEAAAWDKVAVTVRPLHPVRTPKAAAIPVASPLAERKPAMPPKAAPPPARKIAAPLPKQLPPQADAGLDSHWERRFIGGATEPDFTLDLHGHTLDSAHARLDDGLIQAKAMGARVVLLIVFMVTAPLLTVGVPVNLPQTQAGAMTSENQPITVSVNPEGEIYLQETAIPIEEVVPKLQAIATTGYNERIFVRADTAATYGIVMQVMARISSAGFTNIGLVTLQEQQN